MRELGVDTPKPPVHSWLPEKPLAAWVGKIQEPEGFLACDWSGNHKYSVSKSEIDVFLMDNIKTAHPGLSALKASEIIENTYNPDIRITLSESTVATSDGEDTESRQLFRVFLPDGTRKTVEMFDWSVRPPRLVRWSKL